MEKAYLTILFVGLSIHLAMGKTSSLVLHLAPTVVAGQNAQYNCSSEGTGADPTIVWSIKDATGVEKLSNSQLSSQIVEGTADPNDGKVKSSVTFLVTSEYLTSLHHLWCGAIDSGSSTPSIQIYATIQGTTTTTANLGESCSASITCAIANSYCDSSTFRCRCNTGYYDNNGENVAGGSCSIQGSLGSVCQAGNDLSCGTLNSRCSSTSPYLCVCQSGYTQSGSTCIVNSGGYQDSCVNPTRTCNSNLVCSSGICQCSSGSTYSSVIASCVSSSAFYGESCVNPQRTCVTSNSFCGTSGTCVCNTGTTYSIATSACVTNTAVYGESCINPTRTCTTSNSFCGSSGTCQCNSGYIYSTTTASCIISTALYNEPCINPQRTCTTTNSVCGTSGICQCSSGTTYSSATASCVSNTAVYGESCINPTRACLTSNSFCGSSGTCQCNSGFTYSTTVSSCITNTAGYGESCLNPTRTCVTSNANCNTGTCQCNSGYTYSSSAIACVTSIAGNGESCTNPTRTCISNANCNTGYCQCNSGYVYAASVAACIVNTAEIGESCTNPTRTCISSANCTSGTCQCITGYVYSASTSSCVSATAYPGESCINPTRSCVTSSYCDGSVCRCNSGYYQTTSQTCVLKHGVGQTCSSSVINSCSDPNASCVGNISPVCTCNAGYTNTGGTCTVTSTATSCPAGTNVPSTVQGISSPVSASTPTVQVAQTCYEVDLYGTLLLGCSDTKQSMSLQSARWIKLPSTQIVTTTGQFINGDIATPSLTVSNAQSSYTGSYICQLCYGASYTRCTNSSVITLNVLGTEITSVSVAASTTTPLKGEEVTLTCNVVPSGAASSYQWFRGNSFVGSQSTYTMTSVQPNQAGDYTCRATNSHGTVTSPAATVDVRYLPEPFGGNTITTTWNFDDGSVDIECKMSANPPVTTYFFYNGQNISLTSSSSNKYTVTATQGYQTYRCKAQNSIGLSQFQNLAVVEAVVVPPNTGAATENSGIGTGTIAAIVLGIIFFILLLIIIIVCCCSYGWCRKKEKVEPQIIEQPVKTQYIPRTIVSATSTVSQKDVGVMMNGHHDVSVSTDFEEPRYTTPRYYLKPAKDTGPIISIYDHEFKQPRAHQLPALDTQYLYADEEPKKRHKKRRKHRRPREDVSPRRQHYETEPNYAEVLPGSDESLVVVPGKQNYFE